MTSSYVLSDRETRTVAWSQKVCLGLAVTQFLGWWCRLVPLEMALIGIFISIVGGGARWRGEWLGELAIRAIRFHTRSRFSSVEWSVDDSVLVITCRGQRTASIWRSEHRGRLDLRNEEQLEWGRVLRHVDAAAQRGVSENFSFHVRGYMSWVATQSIELPPPWVNDSAAVAAELPRWIYESWNDVQTNDAFYRTFDIRDYRSTRDSAVDALSDREGRWSLHAHFFSTPHRGALRQSRRDRHAADAAMSWKVVRGVTSPATLNALRITRQHHEERVARGAALIDFRLCVVVKATSRQALNDVSRSLHDVATRHGIVLHAPRGDQARALIGSWPGASTW